METTQIWCGLHGGTYETDKPWQHRGYCTPCWNKLVAWQARRRRAGLPSGIAVYREVHGLEKHPKPRKDELVLFTCKVCLEHPRERGVFCRGCHNAYCQWAIKRRQRGAEVGLNDFKLAVDSGAVVPRHKGEPHSGRVVRMV